MKPEIFLDLYRNLEQLVKGNYAGRKFESPIINFSNSQQGKPYKEELNAIREIRNLLVHLPMIDGTYPIEPSDEIGAALQEVIESIEHPLKAMDFAVKIENIMKTKPEDNAFQIMTRMEENGYSHVPVVMNGKLDGVFSKSTVFSWLINHGNKDIHKEMLIQDFEVFTRINSPHSEYYEFAARNALYIQVRELFEKTYQRKSRRLAAMFITENGHENERLLGMITPWDVLKNGPRQ